ncbi:hypothetical protein OTU49_001443, partial [Cherax quadricarinatus]
GGGEIGGVEWLEEKREEERHSWRLLYKCGSVQLRETIVQDPPAMNFRGLIILVMLVVLATFAGADRRRYGQGGHGIRIDGPSGGFNGGGIRHTGPGGGFNGGGIRHTSGYGK